MAVVWKLPVVFVCENNLYMEYTPIASVTAVKRPAADRAAPTGSSHRGRRQRRRRVHAAAAAVRTRARGDGPR